MLYVASICLLGASPDRYTVHGEQQFSRYLSTATKELLQKWGISKWAHLLRYIQDATVETTCRKTPYRRHVAMRVETCSRRGALDREKS